MDLSRRNFFVGTTASLVTAPAIVRAVSIMPVKVMPLDVYGIGPGLAALDALRIHDAMMAEIFRTMGIPSHWLTEKGQRALGQPSR